MKDNRVSGGRTVSEKKEDRREQILSAAAKLFSEKGFERSTFTDLAGRIGFTKAALYYYYRSKEQLLFELMQEALDRVASDLKEIVESNASGLDKLKDFLISHVRYFTNHPGENAVLANEIGSLNDEHRQIVTKSEREYVKLVSRIVSEILQQRPSQNMNVIPAVFALLGSLNWLFTWYDPEGRITPEELAEDFLKLYRDGLGGGVPVWEAGTEGPALDQFLTRSYGPGLAHALGVRAQLNGRSAKEELRDVLRGAGILTVEERLGLIDQVRAMPAEGSHAGGVDGPRGTGGR